MTGALRGTLAAGLVAACGVLLARLEGVSWQVVAAVLGGVLVLAIVAPIARSLARRNGFEVARTIDRRAQTFDLFSSALAFSRRSTHDPMVEAVFRQAADASRRISVARLRPVDIPVRATTFLVAGALLALAWFLPLPAQPAAPGETQPSRAAVPLALGEEREDLRQEGRKLVERLKEEKEDTEERELGEKLDEMWSALDTGEADREEVVENIARMASENVLTSTDQLEKLLEYLERLAETMERAPELEKPAKELAQGRTQPMADEMARLAEKAGEGALSEDQQRGLGKVMKEGSEVPSETSQALADALAKAARSLDASNLPQSASALDQASQAMGDLERRLAALNKMSDLMKHLNALKRMAMAGPPRTGQQSESRFTMLSPSSLGNPTPARLPGDIPGSVAADAGSPSEGAAQSSAGDPKSGSDGVGTSPADDGLAQRTNTPGPGEDSSVSGELSGEGDIATIIYDSARFAGRAGASYRRVHASAVDLLEASLSRERIPPERSAMVREYFELIAPTSGARPE